MCFVAYPHILDTTSAGGRRGRGEYSNHMKVAKRQSKGLEQNSLSFGTCCIFPLRTMHIIYKRFTALSHCITWENTYFIKKKRLHLITPITSSHSSLNSLSLILSLSIFLHLPLSVPSHLLHFTPMPPHIQTQGC